MFPYIRDILVIHIADTLGTLFRRSKATKAHVVRHTMVAEVLLGIELPPGIDGTYFQAGFTQRLDRDAATSSCANHNYVEFSHIVPSAAGRSR